MSPLQKWSVIIMAAVGILFVSVVFDSPAQAQAKHDCSWCHNLHGSGGFGVPLSDYGTDQELCLSCHQDGPPLTWGVAEIPIPKGVAVHDGTKYGAFEASCVDCHDHDGETTNLKLIGGSDGAGTLGVVDHWGKFPGGADKPVVYTATTGINSLANNDGAPYDSLCQVCHTQTSDGTGLINRHRQNEDSADVHNSGTNCLNCHLHAANFSGAGGGCTGCHNQVQGPRRDVVSEFSYTSHHINWVAAGYASTADIPDSDCEVCHNQATHQDGVVDLNDVDTGAAGVYNMAVAADVATFCTKCHDADGASTLGGVPFSDDMIPPVIDGAEWFTDNTEHQVQFTTGACLECHTSGHGKQKADLFVVCETCHGATGTAKFATPHYDPHTVPVNYSWYCTTCHTPHTNLKNKFYTDGTPHPHYDGTGTLESTVADGHNIKLYGRDEDGSGSTKLRTPLQVITAFTDGSGPCATANTELEIYLPPFLPDGEGPAFSIMVGDRLEVDNTDATFDGFYRVKETVWDNLAADPPTGWVCYDHPTNAPYAGTGWVQSGGWGQKPTISSADMVDGIATLNFSGPTSIIYGIHSIEVGDIINVIGVSDSAFNVQETVTAVSEASVTYDIGSVVTTTGTGGSVEYVGSVKEITGIAIQGPPIPTIFNITAAIWTRSGGDRFATITAPGHTYVGGETVAVSGVIPTGYNGTHTVRAVSGNDFEYNLGSDPGTGTAFGTVQEIATGTYNLVVTLNTNNNDAAILNMKAASAGLRDGDIVRIYGANPSEYNERWEIDEGGIDAVTNPPTITLRCPPRMRVALNLPSCNIASMGVYVSGAVLQSTGTMRDTVFDSRGTDHADGVFLGDYGHSFANTDLPELTQDGYMYGPCETCHTGSAMAHHQTFDYGDTHNNGRTCSKGCHWHSVGFDKASDACPRPLCITGDN